MLAYAASLITLVLAVLGVFFSRNGQQNPVTKIGYLILALVVVSGALSLYKDYQAHKSSDAARDSNIDLTEKVAAGNEEISQLKGTIQRLEQGNIQSRLDLGAKIKYGVFSLSYPDKVGIETSQSGTDQPNTTDGRAGSDFFGTLYWQGGAGPIAKLTFHITDVFYGDYEFVGLPNKILEVRSDSSGAERQYGSYELLGCLSKTPPAPDSCTHDGESVNGRWFMDYIAGASGDGVQLVPDITAQRLLAMIEQTEDFGKLVYPIDSDHAFEAITRELKTIDAEVKFYVEVVGDKDEECAKTVRFPIKTSVSRDKGNIAIRFEKRGDSILNLCEHVPI